MAPRPGVFARKCWTKRNRKKEFVKRLKHSIGMHRAQLELLDSAPRVNMYCYTYTDVNDVEESDYYMKRFLSKKAQADLVRARLALLEEELLQETATLTPPSRPRRWPSTTPSPEPTMPVDTP